MVTKAIWPAIAATFIMAGCATVSSEAENTVGQQFKNQQLSDLDAKSTTGTVNTAGETGSNRSESAKKNVTTKPLNDPGFEAKPQTDEVAPDPEQVVVRLQQTALQLQSEGKWQEAETVLQRALRIDVKKVDIYHQLATVRMGQQRFDEAEQIAMKGLTYTDKTPRFKASLWDVIAQCRSAQGDIKGANEAREEMLKWME